MIFMDLFLTKDEKIKALEKRLNRLERRMEKNYSNIIESFETFRRTVIELQRENAELKKDRDFLLKRYKEVIRLMNRPLGPVIEPIKKEIQDNTNLIRDIILEDIEPKKGNIDDLFELVMKRRKISAKSAARSLNVDEKQITEWAKRLEAKNLIKVSVGMGRVELARP